MASTITCPGCRENTATYDNTGAWGDTIECTACGYRQFIPIGD